MTGSFSGGSAVVALALCALSTLGALALLVKIWFGRAP